MDPYTNVVCPDCGHHTRVKCELGHYLLTSRYAVGGMSMVFAARDTTLERDVELLSPGSCRVARRDVIPATAKIPKLPRNERESEGNDDHVTGHQVRSYW